jgi:hypothetical protein
VEARVDCATLVLRRENCKGDGTARFGDNRRDGRYREKVAATPPTCFASLTSPHQADSTQYQGLIIGSKTARHKTSTAD